VEEAKETGEIFHPNCVHTTSPYLLYEREGKIKVLGRDIPEEEIQLGKFGVEATGPTTKTKEMMDWLEEQIRVNGWDKKKAAEELSIQFNIPKNYNTVKRVIEEVFARTQGVKVASVAAPLPPTSAEVFKPQAAETEFERLNNDIRSYIDHATIRQAEQWAVQGNIPVNRVDYTQLDLEFANLINQEMYAHTRLWGRLGLNVPKISISVNVRGNSDASMRYIVESNQPTQLLFNKIYNMREATKRDVRLKVDFQLRANHWIVDTRLADGPNLTAKAMMDHELGHYLENTIAYRGDTQGWVEMWRKLYRKHRDEVSKDISTYANTSEKEGFAESYAWYVNKDKAAIGLADWVVKFFDSVFVNKTLRGEKAW
jgi:hypothetical protein